jgi:DNA-binding LacI/PurR family transcriptional regulator
MDIKRQFGAAMAFEQYEERMAKDEAFPIILVGKTEDDDDPFCVYTDTRVGSEMTARTLLKLAILIGGLESVEEWFQEAKECLGG